MKVLNDFHSIPIYHPLSFNVVDMLFMPGERGRYSYAMCDLLSKHNIYKKKKCKLKALIKCRNK